MDRTTSHEEDVYAWAYEQVAILRDLAQTRRDLPNALDIENLCEEIEGLARTDLREAESFLRLLLVHLIKVASAPDIEAAGHWRVEINTFQADFETMTTPTILRKLRVAKQWQLALEQATIQLQKFGDAVLPGLPGSCPLKPAELVGDSFDVDDALARIRASAAAPEAQPAP